MTRKFIIEELLKELPLKNDGKEYTVTDIARDIEVSHNTVRGYAQNEATRITPEIVTAIEAWFAEKLNRRVDIWPQDKDAPPESVAPTELVGAAL